MYTELPRTRVLCRSLQPVTVCSFAWTEIQYVSDVTLVISWSALLISRSTDPSVYRSVNPSIVRFINQSGSEMVEWTNY